MLLVNAKIVKAGLYFNGHYNRCYVRIVLKMRHGAAFIELPIKKTPELMSMFSDELDLENGVFVSDLKGIPAVLKLDGNNEYEGKIVAIGNVLSNENEMLYINQKSE